MDLRAMVDSDLSIVAAGSETGLCAIRVRAGGPGSGPKAPCDNCGPKGGGKGTNKTHVPKSATVKPGQKLNPAYIDKKGRMHPGQTGPKKVAKSTKADKIAIKSVLNQLKGIDKVDLTTAERHIMMHLQSGKSPLEIRKAVSRELSGIDYQDMTTAERNIRNLVGNY